MQIIDELETNQRGPYGGGMGYVSFNGAMDMALALRTMIIPTSHYDTLYNYRYDHHVCCFRRPVFQKPQ